MKNPLVSIVIPVYNGSNYLAEAIDSALAQTYKNIEIIVINDGSNDDGATENMALSYGDKIRYFKKENGGVSTALNFGIEKMNGNYFSWLSHDDLYLPKKIEEQVELIDGDSDIILCSGSMIDENRKTMPYKPKLLNGKYNGVELFKEFLNGYALNGLGFLIPKKVFTVVGGFDETMRYLQDLDLWLRIMHFDHNFICQNEMLVISRIHKNQVTNTLTGLFYVDQEKIAKKHVKLLESKNNKFKNELLLLYLYLFIKDENRIGIDLVKNELRSENQYNFSVFVRTIPYKIKGKIKKVYRKAYNTILKLKKARG